MRTTLQRCAIILIFAFIITVVNTLTVVPARAEESRTNPASNLLIKLALPTQISVDTLTVSGNYVYLGWHPFGYGNPPGGFGIVSIEDPSSCKLAWSSKGLPYPTSICVVDNIAYVAFITRNKRGPEGRLETFDVTNPIMPKPLGGLDLDGPAEELTDFVPICMDVANGCVFLGMQGGMNIVDAGDPSVLRLLKTYLTLGFKIPQSEWMGVSDICVDGARAYLAGRGLRVLDITDLSSPKPIGSYIFAGDAQSVTVQDGKAYLVVFEYAPGPEGTHELESARLDIVDVADASNLRLLQGINLSKDTRSVVLGNGVVYLVSDDDLTVNRIDGVKPSFSNDKLVIPCCNGGGFKVFDVSVPTSPRLLGTYLIEGDSQQP